MLSTAANSALANSRVSPRFQAVKGVSMKVSRFVLDGEQTFAEVSKP
jgi:hypothetical protein